MTMMRWCMVQQFLVNLQMLCLGDRGKLMKVLQDFYTPPFTACMNIKAEKAYRHAGFIPIKSAICAEIPAQSHPLNCSRRFWSILAHHQDSDLHCKSLLTVHLMSLVSSSKDYTTLTEPGYVIWNSNT